MSVAVVHRLEICCGVIVHRVPARARISRKINLSMLVGREGHLEDDFLCRSSKAKECKEYIQFIEEFTGVPIGWIGVGV